MPMNDENDRDTIASVFIATSLDGFIAREDGAVDWLPPFGDEDYGYSAFMKTIDALVMGRKTFDRVLAFGGAWPYTKPVIVLTTQPSLVIVPDGAICEAMSGAPREIVSRLADRGMKRLYVDGGLTIQRFLDAGLIRRMIITRVPVLLGRGIPLFGPLQHDVHFTHVVTHAYPDGLVESEYVLAADA
jgi:dihydrofolate reductase